MSVKEDIQTLARRGATSPPTYARTVAELSHQLGLVDQQYLELLVISDGILFKDEHCLFPIQELPDLNEGYHVQKYLPHLVLVGSDGGGTVYFLERDKVCSQVWSMRWTFDPEDGYNIWPSLAAWMEDISIEWSEIPEPDDAPTAPVDIYLTRIPSTGIQQLLPIKQVLGLDTSIVALRQNVEARPALLLSGVPYLKYRLRCEKMEGAQEYIVITVAGNPEIVLWPVATDYRQHKRGYGI